jgi:hypothetical protein
MCRILHSATTVEYFLHWIAVRCTAPRKRRPEAARQ